MKTTTADRHRDRKKAGWIRFVSSRSKATKKEAPMIEVGLGGCSSKAARRMKRFKFKHVNGTGWLVVVEKRKYTSARAGFTHSRRCWRCLLLLLAGLRRRRRRPWHGWGLRTEDDDGDDGAEAKSRQVSRSFRFYYSTFGAHLSIKCKPGRFGSEKVNCC